MCSNLSTNDQGELFVVFWPFELIFSLNCFNGLKVFINSTVQELEMSSIRMLIYDLYILLNIIVEVLSKLKSKISTDSKEDMISHVVLAILIYAVNELLSLLSSFLEFLFVHLLN
jgi:hypothetical protein